MPQIPWSAPELLEVWLNEWAHRQGYDADFQVLNAGREGVTTADIAAIVRQEVIPLRPDLVVFYHGAINFDWSAQVADSGRLKALPAPLYDTAAGPLVEAARKSSLLARAMMLLGDAGTLTWKIGEPQKPAYTIAWPAGVDEQHPDIARPDLPLNMSDAVGDLEQSRTDLAVIGSDFALSSFLWLVDDGLKVDAIKGRHIWEMNNRFYWPWTYHDLRRGIDFTNRVYKAFAEKHRLSFLDVDQLVPRDPDLFADGLHMTESGVRVKAWAFFKELLEPIKAKLASRQWPIAKDTNDIPTFQVREKKFDCPG
jgi:hypothetical protein